MSKRVFSEADRLAYSPIAWWQEPLNCQRAMADLLRIQHDPDAGPEVRSQAQAEIGRLETRRLGHPGSCTYDGH
jgi:hypothetical protein